MLSYNLEIYSLMDRVELGGGGCAFTRMVLFLGLHYDDENRLLVRTYSILISFATLRQPAGMSNLVDCAQLKRGIMRVPAMHISSRLFLNLLCENKNR